MARSVLEYEIVDHGIEHSQYFQGCGVSYTKYLECVTGIGDDFEEAIGDCLESLAQMDWDVEDLEKRILEEFGGEYPQTESVTDRLDYDCADESERENCELWYHVSIRVN